MANFICINFFSRCHLSPSPPYGGTVNFYLTSRIPWDVFRGALLIKYHIYLYFSSLYSFFCSFVNLTVKVCIWSFIEKRYYLSILHGDHSKSTFAQFWQFYRECSLLVRTPPPLIERTFWIVPSANNRLWMVYFSPVYFVDEFVHFFAKNPLPPLFNNPFY